MIEWAHFVSVGAEVILVPAFHFVATTWAIGDSVEKLRWSDGRVPTPTKLQDLYKDGWALARRLISRWEADHRALEIERQQRLLNTLGWGVYSIGALTAVVGIVMGNRPFGDLEITGEDVEAIAQAVILAPFAATVLVAARARSLVRRYSP